MRTSLIIAALLINLNLLHSGIVINEVFYDPSGSDGGYEWIELFNNSDSPANLIGWEINKAGTTFETLLILPNATVEPQAHFLIGDEFVENSDLIAELSFQNGGSATDGIRIMSPDGVYSDTILYDEPNTNLLPDDLSDPGQFFAPDVAGGHSLARISDGADSDNCQSDWFDCETPTPGAANFYPIDLEISYLNIVENGANYEAIIGVKNLSTPLVDNWGATLEITINSGFYLETDLPLVNGGDSLEVQLDLGTFPEGYYVTTAVINYMCDIELVNNSITSAFLCGSTDLVLNEILFKPDDVSFEWIELYNISACGYDVDNFEIIDASGAKIIFSGYIEAEDYLVVCENREHMLFIYPEIPENKLVQSLNWTSLNNTEETLIFSDCYNNIFEILTYDGSDCPENISLERINPYIEFGLDNQGYALEVPTPGYRNSIYVVNLPKKEKLQIDPNPFSPYRSERTIISFKLPEKLSKVTIRIFDLKGREKKKITDQSVQAAEGEFIWDGRDDSERVLQVGVYLLLMEAASLATEKVYRQIETIVIGK